MAYTTIDNSVEYFNTKLYTGTGSTQSITGVGFQPDWVWFKDRTNAYGHDLYDSARGATYRLQSNDTGEESLTATGLTSFDIDGFSMGSFAGQNSNGANYVSWCWKANGAGVSNTAGTITSTVSANTTSGFSIVTYTGNGTNGATIGHGLGVAPKMVIPKCRSNAGDWSCYHASLSASNNIFLNATQAQSAIVDRDNGGISTTSSTTFTTAQGGTSLNSVNGSGRTYIAYCFAEVKGYSKFGSYTGNGDANGTFVYTGFKPALVMVKRSDSTGSWLIHDNKRNTFNVANLWLGANLTNAETTSSDESKDFLSNGWKIRGTGTAQNTSGGTYIYMAFAESPFTTSTGIPTTAR